MTMIDAATPGRTADTPAGMSVDDWKDILWRVRREVVADRITLIAAGATFYLLLALFPALAAFVSVYGFVADPVTVADQIALLGTVLPSGGMDLIRGQLESLAQQNSAALSFGFVAGFLVALWSANNGIKTLFEALNIAYEEREKRSFLWLNAISFTFTIGAIAVGVLFIVMVGVVPATLALVGLSGQQELLITLLRWPVVLIVSAAGIALLYRYGPSREKPKWRWVTWGSVLTAIVWLGASILFSLYLTNFADYNATYGSLGAVIGFMLWTWISVVILLLGAELNAELEHQTARDSTTGAEKPMGLRGAHMADTLGKARGDVTMPASAARQADPSLRGSTEDAATSRASWLRPVLGLALPIGAFGVGVALAALDPTRHRRRRDRGENRPDEPNHNEKKEKTAMLGASLLAPLRAALDSPAFRRQVVLASRAAATAAMARARARNR